MRKIPVFRAIARAYGFGFGHFGTALTIAWLPYALLVVAAWFLLATPLRDLLNQFFVALPEKLDAAGDSDTHAEAEHFVDTLLPAYFQFYRFAVLFFLAGLLLQAIAAVGLTRASMGVEQNDRGFYFSLDKQVWKLFGAWIATYLIVYAAELVFCIAAIFIGIPVTLALMPVSVGAAVGFVGLLVLTVLAAVAYVSIRLNFFLPPVIVSEKKLDILRTWNLSEGNAWRILGIYIALLPPLIALVLVGAMAKLIVLFVYLPHWLHFPPRLVESADWSLLAQIAASILPWLPPLAAAAFLLYVLCSAMLYAATARAYRGLVATDIASQTPD